MFFRNNNWFPGSHPPSKFDVDIYIACNRSTPSVCIHYPNHPVARLVVDVSVDVEAACTDAR